jgi:V8-like Glu-specific endopeptidase
MFLSTRMRQRAFKRLALGGLILAEIAEAHAQTVGFNPTDYGRAQLPLRQTTGDAVDFIDRNKGAFEPIAELDPKDPIAASARPIGRIDVVLRNARTGQMVGASCTGTLVSGDYVLTNHHCLPQVGDLTPVKASILMDYLTLDGRGSKRFEIETRPAEFDAGLDYAVAKAAGNPTREYGMARISGEAVPAARSMLVIHHPLGRPKVMSRFRCFAMKDQPGDANLHHRCDTLGGSSGSLMFDGSVAGIALHKEGGLDPKDPSSFNSATRLSAILKHSHILSEIAGEQVTPVANTKTPRPSPASNTVLGTDQMNSIMRGK